VRVEIDPADRPLTSALNITTSGLTVRLTRGGSQDAPRTAVTDASGTVRFDQLLDGTYTVSVERPLSGSEVARLDPSDREVTILAGGSAVKVSPPTAASTTVSLVGARRGGLVISEALAYVGNPPYNWGQYIEVFNNGDSTAYLDGYILAKTSYLVLHTQSSANCDEPSFDAWRSDTARLWVEFGIQFPGSGREFPLRPGESRVYAQDALDHRAASGSGDFADLARADFEHFAGAADTDNPVAANVASLFSTGTGTGGRGLRVSGAGVWALIRPGPPARFRVDTARPINPGPVGGLPGQPRALFGVPRADIDDVFPVYFSPAKQAWLRTTTGGLATLCRPFVQPAFDRLEAELEDERFPGAMRRRSLGRTADGREILMRTKTAARDWELSPNLLTRWWRTP
jgi:hypothetical protein